MSTKEQILQQLRRHPSTLTDLSTNLHRSPDGIRGRISELRKVGYSIQNNNNIYTLLDNASPENKITTWVVSNNYFGKELDYDTISTELNLPINTIETSISHLFRKYHIIQTSKNSCVFQKI
jgi:biotin operon repressor